MNIKKALFPLTRVCKLISICTFIFSSLFVFSNCRARSNARLQDANAGSPHASLDPALQFGINLSDFKSDSTSGAAIDSFTKDHIAPGCVMGLRKQDVITAINGFSVTDGSKFSNAVKAHVNSGYRGLDGFSGDWCFKILRNNREQYVPANCNLQRRAGRGAAGIQKTSPLCSGRHLYECGPITKECM